MSTADRREPPAPHYNRHDSGVECWDLFDVLPSNIAAALKYLWRADHKGQKMRDLQKASDHLCRYIRANRSGVLQMQTHPPMALTGMADKVGIHEPDHTLLFHMLGVLAMAPVDGFPERRLLALVAKIDVELDRLRDAGVGGPAGGL